MNAFRRRINELLRPTAAIDVALATVLPIVCLCAASCQKEGTATGDTADTSDADQGEAPRGRLEVSDGKLLDGAGNHIALLGLGLGTLSYIKDAGKWNEDYFANARDWGAELVRLPLSPIAFREDTEGTLRDLDDAVRWCEAHELYLIIDYHVTGNPSDGFFQFGEFTTWEDAEAFWEKVAPRYADVPTVAFAEVFNEPAALTDQGGTLGFEEWQDHANALVAIVRDKAPDMIPLVAGLDFAYDFSPGGDTPFEDPDIALSVHPYPGRARQNRRADWDASFGYLSDRYPIVLTELGFDPYDEIYPPAYLDDLPYGREIASYAAEKQMSWTAFVFFNDPIWPMPLFSDWETLKPTVSGLFFKDVLQGIDLDAAGEEFGDRPEVTYPKSNGPSDLYWTVLWADKGASAEWISEPTPERAELRIKGDGIAQAGAFMSFTWDTETVDTSEFNEIVIHGAVAEDAPFSITLGRNEGHAESVFVGCNWDMKGKGEAEYIVDLLSPNWCGPDSCFDMQASGIGINTTWGTGDAVDVTVESLDLHLNPDKPLPEAGIIGTATYDK